MLAVAAVLLAGAPAASAHAHLLTASPAGRSTVTTAPTQVTLTFDEAVRAPAVLVVTGPDGRRVDRGRPRLGGTVVRVGLAPALAPGDYTVAFRVVSDDGHPVAEQLSFTYAPAGASPPAGSTGAPPAAGGHQHAGDAGSTNGGWVVGAVAALLLAGGLALLGARRRGPAPGRAP
jgi:copper resistance protein C